MKQMKVKHQHSPHAKHISDTIAAMDAEKTPEARAKAFGDHFASYNKGRVADILKSGAISTQVADLLNTDIDEFVSDILEISISIVNGPAAA